ncbi:MAG TPA: hypothetical protein VGN01_07660 [Acidobacteriaceae bacterium]|jgi:hypothetical protein
MMKCFVTGSVCLFCCLAMFGQQPQTSKTTVDSQGNKEVIDITTGVTDTDKAGKVIQHISAADLTQMCAKLDDREWLNDFKAVDNGDGKGAWAAMTALCDDWGELQPRTHIERLPFTLLVSRLLLISPIASDFARYRGMELKTAPDATTYDAVILPRDLGYDANCDIEEQNRHIEGMMYTYRCSIKTPSFPEAIALKERLVQSLKKLDLGEDEVREHGLSAHAQNSGYCAPSGECLEGNVYVSATKDYKFFQIEANPILTRNVMAQIGAMKYGKDAPIDGISDKAASVSFEVFSVGPLKP